MVIESGVAETNATGIRTTIRAVPETLSTPAARITVPNVLAVTRPAEVIVAMAVSELLHVTDLPGTPFPAESSGEAVICRVCPMWMLTLSGDTTTRVTDGPGRAGPKSLLQASTEADRSRPLTRTKQDVNSSVRITAQCARDAERRLAERREARLHRVRSEGPCLDFLRPHRSRLSRSLRCTQGKLSRLRRSG